MGEDDARCRGCRHDWLDTFAGRFYAQQEDDLQRLSGRMFVPSTSKRRIMISTAREDLGMFVQTRPIGPPERHPDDVLIPWLGDGVGDAEEVHQRNASAHDEPDAKQHAQAGHDRTPPGPPRTPAHDEDRHNEQGQQ